MRYLERYRFLISCVVFSSSVVPFSDSSEFLYETGLPGRNLLFLGLESAFSRGLIHVLVFYTLGVVVYHVE